MRVVADSLTQVARLERIVSDDRRSTALAVERLKAGAVALLSRTDVQTCLFAAGALVGASGPGVLRRLVCAGYRLASATPSRSGRSVLVVSIPGRAGRR